MARQEEKIAQLEAKRTSGISDVLNLREEDNVQGQTTRVGQTEGGQEGEEGGVGVGHALGGDNTMQPDVGVKSVAHLPMTSMRPKVIAISPVMQASSRSGKWAISPVIQPSFCSTGASDSRGEEERSARIRMMEIELLRMDKEIAREKEEASRVACLKSLREALSQPLTSECLVPETRKDGANALIHDLMVTAPNPVLHHEPAHVKKNDSKEKVELLLSMTQLAFPITPPLTQTQLAIRPPFTPLLYDPLSGMPQVQVALQEDEFEKFLAFEEEASIIKREKKNVCREARDSDVQDQVLKDDFFRMPLTQVAHTRGHSDMVKDDKESRQVANTYHPRHVASQQDKHNGGAPRVLVRSLRGGAPSPLVEPLSPVPSLFDIRDATMQFAAMRSTMEFAPANLSGHHVCHLTSPRNEKLAKANVKYSNSSNSSNYLSSTSIATKIGVIL